MEFNWKAFAARLGDAIQRSGKSVKEIETACHIGEFLLDFFLDGHKLPSASQLFNLCVCLDVGADWLLGIKALRESEE